MPRAHQYLLILSLTAATAFAQTGTHFPLRDHDAVSFHDALWIASPRGLFEYRPAENIWSIRGEGTGLRSSTITRLASDGDVLWMGMDQGVTRHDAHANTFLYYDSSDGIPPGRTLAIGFEDDYVWVGTESGAARYDRLIEQWQTFDASRGLAGTRVTAIAPRQGLVYLCTDEAVNEYDPRYERWRQFRPDTGGLRARDAFLTAGYLWILREHDLVRFDYASHVFQPHALGEIGGCGDILRIIIEGDSFWLVTARGLWLYDALADGFRPFQEITNLPETVIRTAAFSPDGSAIWFSTTSGLSRYDRGTRTWQYFTPAGGLPGTDFSALFLSGTDPVGITGTDLVWYRQTENRWQVQPLPQTVAKRPDAWYGIAGASGTWLDVAPSVRLSLTGSRTAWLIRDPGSASEVAKRNDLKAALDLGAGRSVTATYNDADFNDVMEGVMYRGARNDALQVVQWGDLRTERGGRQLLQSFGLFGAGGRMALGARTEKYHRSLVELSAASGHRTTAITSDFFQGRTRVTTAVVRDIDYRRRSIYALDNGGIPSPVESGSVRVFATLVPGEAWSLNHLVDTAIAGVRESWRELAAGRDFSVDAGNGELRLAQAIGTSQRLAAAYTVAGTQRTVLLAAGDSSNHERRNIYFLRGLGIIPATLEVTMSDASGRSIPLSRYGLDDDADGRIDPQHVDHPAGLLRFPAERPFPDQVYTDSARSDVRMNVRFETSTSGVALTHANIVRGSERILVDGLPVRAGDDYVLDYTSGFLLFTRDGVLNDESRVEVHYEYTDHATNERMTPVTLTISPSDNTQASVTAAQFRPRGSAHDATLLHGMAEGRIETGGLDLRLVPEFSRTMSDSAAGNAFALLATASTATTRVSVQMRRSEPGAVDAFPRLFPGGRLTSETAANGEYDAVPGLRLFADWRRRGGVALPDGRETMDELADAGVQWYEAGLPSLTLRAENLFDRAGEVSNRRLGLRLDVDWVPTPRALDLLGLAGASISGIVHVGRERSHTGGDAVTDNGHRHWYLRTVVSPVAQTMINAHYRGDEQDRAATGGAMLPFRSTQRLFADLVMESVRGLSLGTRITSDLAILYHGVPATTWDATGQTTFQFTSRFSPGLLAGVLPQWTLEANVQQSHSGTARDGGGFQPMLLSLLRSIPAAAQSSVDATMVEAKAEWRPAPEVVCILTGRYTETTVGMLSTRYADLRRDLIQRLDYRPTSMSLTSLQFAYTNGSTPWSAFDRYAPTAWIEHRWNRTVLTRVTINASLDQRRQGRDRITTWDVAPAASITLTFTPAFIERIELRNDLGYRLTTTRTDPDPILRIVADRALPSLSNIVYLDFHPLSSSYMRVQHALTHHIATAAQTARTVQSLTVQLVLQL